MAKVNSEPRVSVNKLGEYLLANASRRRKIIYDCKYPAEFIVKRYNDAEKAIAEYYSAEKKSVDIIFKHIKRIQGKQPKSPYQMEVVKSNLEALDSFIDCTDCVDICTPQNVYSDSSENSAISNIKNLKVSIRPEILIKNNDKIIGGLKLYFSKTNPMSNDIGEYITTLLKYHIEDTHKSKVKPSDCMVLDVFTGLVIYAPKSHKRRLADIEASCEEIVTRWKDL